MTAPRRFPRPPRALLLAAAGLLACALAALLPALDGGGAPGTAEAQARNVAYVSWTKCSVLRVSSELRYEGRIRVRARYRVNNRAEWTERNLGTYASSYGRNTTVAISGLNCVNKYEVAIASGDGYWSTDTVTAPSAPSQVAGLVFQSVNETRISVSWSTPPSYSTITGYTLAYRENQGGTGDWTTDNSIAATVNSKTIGSLTPGTAYEVRVAAKTSVGTGAWSEILFARTSASLFANKPPDDLKITELSRSPTAVNLSLSWSAVTGVTLYEVEQRLDDVLTTLRTGTAPGSAATDTHLEMGHTKDENDAGEFSFRVRARKGSGGSAQYTPWSPEAYYRFYGEGKVEVPSQLAAEVAGNRELPADVRAVRDGVGGAVEQVFAPTGLQVDGEGIAAAVAILPCLAVFLFVAGLGWQAGAPAMGLGAGYALMTLGLFVGNALLGLDIIWPMLAVLVAVLVGGGAAARKLGFF